MHEDSILIGPRIENAGPDSLYPSIAAQCRVRRDAVAISYGERRISYAQLDRQSGLIRDALLAAGLAPGQLVPVLTRGGPGMIAAMIGIWAAGGAFAPLAMDGPEARRDLALGRIDTGILVVDEAGDALDGWRCVPIAETLRATAPTVSIADAEPCHGGSLAYGFFTSGSTGVPKCCLNIHSGLANRAATMSRRFDLRPGEAVLQNSSHVFDSSLWQIFWPLSIGAEVAIPERFGILDFDATLDTIAARRVVMTDFVPSILEQLIQLLRNSREQLDKLASLRYILVGGEKLDPHLLRDLLKLLPAARIVNTYGPTEASIGMVFHAFSGGEAAVPLGLPIDNTALAVVDEQLRPVPRGQIGEIVIGGACMGLGYLGEPERTQAVFRRDTGLPLGSEVVYRTGDLGRVEADGLLYFDGRIDDQIKIAGVRIELGEIEHHLYDFPHVSKAKVLPVRSDDGTWLAGFYTASAEVPPAELRAHLERKLGKSSVPALLRQLDAFPLTVSGKIDGKALIAAHCTFDPPAAGEGQAGQSSDMRQALQAALRRILPGQQPGPDDDLVLAGLDSLGALKLLLEAERLTGRRLALAAFLTAPTLATLLSHDAQAGDDADTARAIEHDIARLGRPASPRAAGSAPPSGTAIVLTGATGYVGRALLAALLRHGAGPIVCPVRAADDRAAAARLAALVPDLPAGRVTAVALDLCAPDASRRLPPAPRLVLHAAADVNFSKSYRQLHEPNVAVTAALGAYALAAGARFVYLSSIAAATGREVVPDGAPGRAEIEAMLAALRNGYSRTKWVSEQIVAGLRAHGLDAQVHRLGEMMPDALHPVANPLASFSILCRVAQLAGVAPELEDTSNCTPTGLVADWVVRRALADSGRAAGTARPTMLAHPTQLRVNDMLAAVLGKIPQVSLSRFLDTVGRHYADSQHPDLARCLMIFSSGGQPDEPTQRGFTPARAEPRPTAPATRDGEPGWTALTPHELDTMFGVFRSSVIAP
ncbi:amino acid adenylation domain-containing protein [Burkholderia plantarii]|uniref:amino acid adenylation domain-containing protein n=1 Tax=Burkholderia plantarii TaxID=41899 RepID=UPI0006D8AEAF|nr:amino acid adenylation domain-containing protein [Burkholderia plantarii]ALK31343.1 amino acid adenylation domain-containing protein [Burkholderia plantarii]GLZ17024.1 hypothetical protein Bpla01_05540 [Burkholderia plantarii]